MNLTIPKEEITDLEAQENERRTKMINNVTIIGRTVNDIELRSTTTGKSVCSFCVAVQRDYDKEVADWIDCVAWGKLAEVVSKTEKGTLVAIQGELQSRNYEDKSGNKRKSIEVVITSFNFLERKKQPEEHSVDELGEDDLPF